MGSSNGFGNNLCRDWFKTVWTKLAVRQRKFQGKPCWKVEEILSISRLEIILYYYIIMEIIYFLTVLFNAYLINCIKWGKEYIVYSEVLLVSILQYYNFSVEIMNELDISNYLTPRYLAELIDDKGMVGI